MYTVVSQNGHSEKRTSLYYGQKPCPQCVRYSETPLNIITVSYRSTFAYDFDTFRFAKTGFDCIQLAII